MNATEARHSGAKKYFQLRCCPFSGQSFSAVGVKASTRVATPPRLIALPLGKKWHDWVRS
jgi:hypothetical protein